MLIPEMEFIYDKWNMTDTLSGGYLNSYINKTILPTAANNLKKVLGTHLVNRNVLLSSSVNSSSGSTAYTWTTAYCTLPSVGQLTGTFAQHNNKYDDGEANYKLPLFDFGGNDVSWARNIFGYNSGASIKNRAYYLNGSYDYVTDMYNIAPLIYIR